MPVIRPIAETFSFGSQVTKPLLFHKLKDRGVAGWKELKQTCNSRLFYFILFFYYLEERVCVYHSTHVKVRAQHLEVGFLLPPQDQGLNSGCGADTASLYLLNHLSAPDTQFLLLLRDRTNFSPNLIETKCLMTKLRQTRNSNSLLCFNSLSYISPV